MFSLKFFRKTLSCKPSQISLLLESVFYWPTFLMVNKYKKVWKVISRKTNTAKRKTLSWKQNHIFYWLKLTEKYFSLTGKCFSLTNFSNDKQTQESLENDFSKTNFRKINEALEWTMELSKSSSTCSLLFHFKRFKAMNHHLYIPLNQPCISWILR